jgi:tetratricopeptide (TPR) repeat protein
MCLRQILLPILSALVLMPGAALAQTTTPTPAPAASPALPVPSVANLLPANTVGVFLLNTNAESWEALSRFGLFPKDMSFPGLFYPVGMGMNFYTDVQPWLGDQVAIALLPNREQKAPNQSLIVSSIKDATKIPRYLERLKASKKKVAIERQYKGITILEWEPEKVAPCQPAPSEGNTVTFAPQSNSKLKAQSSKLKADCPPDQPMSRAINSLTAVADPNLLTLPLPPLPPTSSDKTAPTETPALLTPPGFAIAILPNFVVTATNGGAIEQLINAQTEGKLADNPAFRRTAQKPQFTKALMTGYGDYMKLFSASTQFNQEQFKKLPLGFPVPKIDPNQVDMLAKYYDTVDGYIWAESDGMHMEFGVHFKEPVPQATIDAMATPNEILGRLPEVNYVVANSKNVALFWKVLTTGLEAEPSLKKGLEQFRQFSQKSLGLDDRDIFPWMTGEYVTFLYPTRQGFIPAVFPNADLGLGVMVQTSDRPAAEAAFKKLDQIARTRISKDIVNTRKLQGQPVTVWEGPLMGKPTSFLSHSWVGEDTILLLMGGGAVSEFSPKPARTLPQSSNFKAAIAPFSDDNLGYFYVNGGAVMSLINNSVLPTFMGRQKTGSNAFIDELKATLGSIRSVSGASFVRSDKIQSDSFLALATTRTTPISASELLESGQKKLAGNDFEGAIANLTRVLKLDPENALAYSDRASARLQSADGQGAVEDYSQAIRLNAKTAEVYRGRASAYSSIFDYQKSLADWDQAIQLQSDQPEFYVSRAGVRGALEDFKGAIADADQAIRLDPENSFAYNTRCYVRARGLGDFKGALPDCEKAIEIDAESVDSLASRCYVRANLGDKKALEDCNLALELDLENPSLYEDRGLAHAALKGQPSALEDLQRAAELYQTQGDLTAKQRVEKAIQALKG